MYLRTVTQKKKNGEVVSYYQLAHNQRHPVTRKPIAKVIHSFGRADEHNRDQLVRLCQSIARACGLSVVDPLSISHDGQQIDPADILHGFKIIKTQSHGCVHAIENLWQRLGIEKTLLDICAETGSNNLYERALFAMTANRLCDPQSKLGVWDRWLKKVYLPSCTDLSLDSMYEAMDLLYENAEELEETIFYHTANLFNRDVDLIFYDTTSASFHVDQEDDADGLRRYGYSKEGTWKPMVVVALAVTSDGLPVRSWVFPGNTTDAKTIDRVRTDLRGWNLHRTLFVADSGMNSAANRHELSRACGKYLLATRMGSVAEIKRDVLSARGRYVSLRDNLKAKEVIIGAGMRRRRYILCFNPKEASRNKQHRAQVIASLEQELAKHNSLDASCKWAIDLLASQRYRRYLSLTKSKQIRIDRQKIREAERYDGKWVLETNDDSLSLEDAACGYKGLMVIERCFRTLKQTQIKLTPMYHWLPRRIEAHVKICVLSLLIERVAEIACDKPWAEIRELLEGIQVTEFHTDSHRFFKRNELSSQAKQALAALNVAIPKPILKIEQLI